MIERKSFAITNYAFKADSNDGPGSFEGYGSTWTVDEGGDIITRGAFAEAIPSFLERGFVPVGHDWMGLPVATVSEAKEDETGLYFKAEFHSTATAQDARTVMSERLDRGKFVGLSIGFMPDPDNIEYRDDGVRVIKKIRELAEISFVTVPMNRLASVSAVKSSLSFADEYEMARAAIDGFVARSGALAALRVEEGRSLNQSNRERLATMRDLMRDGSSEIDTILADTDPDRDRKQAEQFRLRLNPLLRDADAVLHGIAD